MKNSFHDQYDTLIRAYKQLERISTDNGNKISNADPDYEVKNFFIHCYHLKDALKKDKTVLITDDVEKYISNNPSLSLAADYANSFKHSGLDRKSRSGKTFDKVNRHLRLDLTPRGFVCSARLELTISGEKYDAFILAQNCMKEWRIFLERNRVFFEDPK
jgi:hypothetical protein